VLVISRKRGESIRVADDIEIVVISVDGQRVRLGVKAPRNIRVLRSELDSTVIETNQNAVIKLNEQAEGILAEVAKARKEKGTP
jgi:carbon storage regulator